METRRLGRTDLNVSLMSLGTGGGINPLGQRTGVPESEIHRLIHQALDLGINLFDTAPAYMDSELILQRALKNVPRDRYLISTKVGLVTGGPDGELASPSEIRASVEASLRRIGIDTIDILLVGGFVSASTYQRIVQEVMPTLYTLQEEGKFRFLGATEKSSDDGAHAWLELGLRDDLFDVVMVAYNLINQSAERVVFPLCRQNDVGAMAIFSVRRTFSQPERLREVIADLKQRGLLGSDLPDDEPLGWLLDDDTSSIINAAYRFVAHHPAVSTVMTGTINPDHLNANVRTVHQPPLPAAKVDRLRQIFGAVAEPVGN